MMRFRIRLKFFFLLLGFFFLIISCSRPSTKNKIPTIGFLDLLEDETLAQARKGFFKALSDSGYIESQKSIQIIYRNAQGDQPTLQQACDYLVSQHVDLIASNPTLSTITAVQKTKEIPVFMMVSPRPDIAGLADASGKYPSNLFGTFETLDYIDTSFTLIKSLFPSAKKVGTIYNQAEPQSVDALKRIEEQCLNAGLTLEKLPVSSSTETQIVTGALINKDIDVFFALPDNIVFSSMEVIVKSCDEKNIPVFTSEEGLVKRGALAAFGADMYQWGYQSGMQAAHFLKSGSTEGIKPEMVVVRRKVANEKKADQFHLKLDSTFVVVR